MTPSNPDNQQPLIYRFCDSAGVFHIVAPVNHTHPQEEIVGLIAALAAKANAADVQTALASINTALGGKMPKISVGSGSIPTDKFLCSDPTGNAYCSPFGPSNFILPVANSTAGNFPKLKADGTIEDSGKKPSDFADAAATEAALANKQDTLTFDTTPTANSTNPVTSGGVKDALDAKRQIRQDDSETLDHAIVAATASDGDVYIMLSVREGDNIKYVHITPDNMDNLIRALLDPDTAPTANSDNLVTSGGIKAAIDNAVVWNGLVFVGYEGTPIDLDWWFQDGHSQMTFLLEAYQHTTLGHQDVNEMFSTGNTGDRIYWQNGEVAVPDECYAIVRVYRKEFGGTVRYFAIAEVCNEIY